MFSAARSAISCRGLQRSIHSSPGAYKSITEKVGDVANKVNKTAGKGLASAIDKGEKATSAAQDTLASVAKDAEKRAQDAVKQTGAQTRKRK